jgi:hypothetical protein
MRVALGNAGEPPLTGSIGNARTVERRYMVQGTTCERYRTTASGAETCVFWNQEERVERETTGASAPFWLVPSGPTAAPSPPG